MRRVSLLAVVVVLFGALCVRVPQAFAESAPSFVSDITVNPDQSLSIQETIQYQTTVEKHGIYRYIPTSYVMDTKQRTLHIHGVHVFDDSSNPIPFQTINDGGNLTLKIGDPNQTFVGSKTYVLDYIVDDALQVTDKGQRLYWDITGEGWTFPIEKASAVVHAPEASMQAVYCYSGAVGGSDGKCSALMGDIHTAMFEYPHAVGMNQNFTVDVQFQGDTGFVGPSPWKKIQDSIVLLVIVVVVGGIPILFFLIWARYGRDYMFVRYDPNDQTPRPSKLRPFFLRITPPMVYEPLKLTPGQAGTMIDESYQTQDLVADILDLARQKYLTIVQTQEHTLLRPAEYQFTKLKDADSALPKHEQLIMKALFRIGSVSLLSDLQGTFFEAIPGIKEAVFDELFSETFFVRDPWTSKALLGALSSGLYVIALIVVWTLFGSLTQLDNGKFVFVVPLLIIDVLSGVLCVLKLTQKTAVGFNQMLLAKGLRETIRRGAWREQIMEKHLFIEEMLPFAVSLGVVDQLVKDMQQLNIPAPSYVGVGTLNVIQTHAFVYALTSNLGSSLTYNPSSSRWGGGSSGGGFSGGGGGGGGGGSW